MRRDEQWARWCAWIVVVAWWLGGCATEKPAELTSQEVEIAVAVESVSRDEFGISQGTVDVSNRYRSVVSIRNGKKSCSGALVAPRLVLTAAHCFCESHGKEAMIMDSSNCAREAAVISYFYRRAKGGWRPGKDVVLGQVIVNESFRSELEKRNDRTLIKSKVADLAVIRLERVLENTTVERLPGDDDVSLKEELTLVGFGATAPDGDDAGLRRFGRNIVTELRLADDGIGREIRFRFPGAHTHAGDSGGPCFREREDDRWLVGINGGYVSQGATESWFTSTVSHRKWIEEQIAAARKLESQ